MRTETRGLISGRVSRLKFYPIVLIFELQGCHSSPLSSFASCLLHSKGEPAWLRESEVWLVKLRCKNTLTLRRCRPWFMGLLPQPFRHSLTSACGIRLATTGWGFGFWYAKQTNEKRDKRSHLRIYFVFGLKFYPIRLLTGRSMIATCFGILNFIDKLFGIRLLGRFMFEVSPASPRSLGYTRGLPTAPPNISIGVATAQSFCGLRSGFESLPDPF